MLEQSGGESEVILFFQASSIAKEMMFAEFEAILDGVVGLEDFAGQNMLAAYVGVNLHLCPVSVCLFKIDFDEMGEAPKNWNVPFRSLVDDAGQGPNLGAGPIQLAIRSQCPTGWYSDSLWDPAENTLELIANSVSRNRLCLPGVALSREQKENLQRSNPEPVQAQSQPHAGYQQMPPPYYNQTMPAQPPSQQVYQANPWQQQIPPGMQQIPANIELPDVPELTEVLFEDKHGTDELIHELEEKHKEKMLAIISKHKQRLNKVHDHAHKIIQKYKRILSEEKIEAHNQSVMFKAQIELLKEQNRDQKKRVEDLLLKIEAQEKEAAKGVKDEIKEGELEKSLGSANETIKNLREELTLLRRDSRRLAENGTDDFFARLENSGLSFIAFHPGAGHVSVAIENMVEYLENPKVFAARKCNITLEAYEYWLQHYEKPECLAKLDGNRVCGEALKRVNHPSDFKSGVSDRCEKHRTGFSASSSVGNFGLPGQK